MPTSLAEAQRNAQTDLDVAVIDEFRKSTLIDLLTFDDVVNPAGGRGTMTYGFRRLVTEATSAARKVNTEYTPQEVTTVHEVVGLGVFGGSYRVDRVTARIGPQASDAVSLNMNQKIKSARAHFSWEVINGNKTLNGFDDGPDIPGFDGLSRLLTGSSTDVRSTPYDWSAVADQNAAFTVMDTLDEFLGLLDGAPGAIITNKRVIDRIRSVARRAGYFTRSEGAAGTTIERYDGIALIDAGKRDGSNDDVIPVTSGAADMYAIRFGLDGFHGLSLVGGSLVQQFPPDFTTPGAVKLGEVELGPAAVVLKATKAAAVARVRLTPSTLAATSEPTDVDPDAGADESTGDEPKTTRASRRSNS